MHHHHPVSTSAIAVQSFRASTVSCPADPNSQMAPKPIDQSTYVPKQVDSTTANYTEVHHRQFIAESAREQERIAELTMKKRLQEAEQARLKRVTERNDALSKKTAKKAARRAKRKQAKGAANGQVSSAAKTSADPAEDSGAAAEQKTTEVK
ncbi:Protein of unknown function DUF1168 [Carpediemonas membranifera]|uniref:Uncharacterized protein n=1 Tax=Carpediemonas membranifera TaxID=201153 RepID=A0A8J6DZV7_9EUKA|nr:Protein of unknown function DUF1168 [Carpediemonas membranifera]|eukprot:KAG9390956.1 Protein of unknown function DUF1168 [Carpediemonas membranifera]